MPLRWHYCKYSALKTKNIYAGLEVLIAVAMKSSVFCDITSCSPVKASRRFGRTHRIHFRGRKVGVLLAAYFISVSCLAYSSSLKVEVIRSSETSAAFTRLYAVIKLKIELFGVNLVLNKISRFWHLKG
jgi:hypothetical protein